MVEKTFSQCKILREKKNLFLLQMIIIQKYTKKE